MHAPLKFAGLLASLLVAAVPVSAQTAPTPTLLDQMVGRWVLTGAINGKETTHDVDAEWVLNHEYVQLHEVSREKDAKGAPAYEAIVFIGMDEKTGEYTCLWLDSTAGGGLSADGIGRGKPSADRIPFVIGLAGSDRIRNTFVYSAGNGTWQWIIDNEIGGAVRPFARLTLRKR